MTVARYRVAIVGAGPHGLTTAVYLVRAGLDVDDLVVIDPSGTWLSTWRWAFAHLGIAHLRSPAVHHPHPDPYALVAFAQAEGRSGELFHTYGLPSTALFDAFCERTITEAGLADRVQAGHVVGLRDDGVLDLADGRAVAAAHIVWAANPAVVDDVATTGPGRHWTEVDGATRARTVAVVGGGLTAAHLAERAVAGGAHVEWVTRRPIQVRDFDTDAGWLGPKEMQRFDRTGDPVERFRLVAAARGGGSVPPWMMTRLAIAEKAGALCRRHGTLGFDPHRPTVTVDGVRVVADERWMAIGDRPSLSAAPALAALCRVGGVATVADLPVVDPGLRVAERVHVLGRLAQLRLGPTAGNLAGARRGAELVVGHILGLDRLYELIDA